MKTFEMWCKEKTHGLADDAETELVRIGWAAAMAEANKWHTMDSAPMNGDRFRVMTDTKHYPEYHAYFSDICSELRYGDGICDSGYIAIEDAVKKGWLWQPIPEFKQ